MLSILYHKSADITVADDLSEDFVAIQVDDGVHIIKGNKHYFLNDIEALLLMVMAPDELIELLEDRDRNKANN